MKPPNEMIASIVAARGISYAQVYASTSGLPPIAIPTEFHATYDREETLKLTNQALTSLQQQKTKKAEFLWKSLEDLIRATTIDKSNPKYLHLLKEKLYPLCLKEF